MDNSAISSNKRIAKNTLMLYLRMFLTMIVGFFTSRVVLNTLGVEDYGIYGVVGGVVAMMGFLNASMSGATSRFLTFELGKGSHDRLAKTFSSALIIHMGIALAVLLLAETVGLWFLCNKLVIPPGRMTAAHWVYQLSIASAMMSITQVPYNATIIAHEKMDVYAYVEILNVTLKLLIVYLLTIGNFDKLILYAWLMFGVSVIVMMVYRLYCIRKFFETHFHWTWDKNYIKPMLSFSGWDLYGNGCVTARQQGTNFLINMFFGVALNAASSIATIINGLVSGLSFNIIQAFRPRIIIEYANDNFSEMGNLLSNAVKYTILLFGCIFTPLFLEMPYAMHLWLGEVPYMSVIFCRILLVSCVIGLINSIVAIGIHATGNIKKISLFSGSFFLFSLPVVYICYKLGFGVQYAYIILIFSNICVLGSNVIILKKQITCLNVFGILKGFVISAATIAVFSFPVVMIHYSLDEGFFRFCIVSLLHVFFIVSSTYFFVIDKSTRIFIRNKLCQKYR